MKVSRFNARDFCSNYEVDARIIDNIDALNNVMDSLKGVEPNAYPLMSQWCRRQRLRMSRMVTSLRNDYKWDGDIAWMDSTHCIIDAGSYIATMEQLMTLLMSRAAEYEQLEADRIEAEKIAHEEERRAELNELKDTIKELNSSIISICDARGVTDKARVKELKDLYYDYLAVFIRYDVASNKADDARFEQLYELKKFQIEMMDSLLGENSFSQRINNFSNILKAKSGKEHAEVFKSYQRCSKKMLVSGGFKSIAEYREYATHQREIIETQQSFLTAIDLRDTISAHSDKLQFLCGRKYREVYTSFREVMSDFNTVPRYYTLADSRKFIDSLHNFIALEDEYAKAVYRIEKINAHSDSILSLCSKGLNDVSAAYKELVSMSDFIPQFINGASVEYYNKNLDNFEHLQDCYVTVIELRKTIDKNSKQLQSNKNMPRPVKTGYRNIARNMKFTPHFTNSEGSTDFINSLNHFIELQGKFAQIAEDNRTIESNAKTIKTAFKNFSYIYRAYTKIYNSYQYKVVIENEMDLKTYRKYQSQVLTLQEVFLNKANLMEKEDLNRRLQKERDLQKIKLIVGVK